MLPLYLCLVALAYTTLARSHWSQHRKVAMAYLLLLLAALLHALAP